MDWFLHDRDLRHERVNGLLDGFKPLVRLLLDDTTEMPLVTLNP